MGRIRREDIEPDKSKITIDVLEVEFEPKGNTVALIRKLPFRMSSTMNQYFVDIANLMVSGSQIISISTNADDDIVSPTHMQLAVYFGVSGKTISNVMFELLKVGALARIKTRGLSYYVVSPEYAIHIDGCNKGLFDMFGVVNNSILDKINEIKKNVMYNTWRQIKGYDDKGRTINE